MPGLSLSMGMMQEQRLEMSQKLEQTITLSMAMVVQQHAVMNLPGVADPERVRIFKLPGRGRHAMTVVAKLLSGDSERPYAEAAALEAFKERGFATPELIGVCSFGEQHLMLTRLERGVVNCATLMTKPTEVLPKYLRQQKVLLTEAVSYTHLTLPTIAKV